MRTASISADPLRTMAGYSLLAAVAYVFGSYVMLPGIDRDALAAHLAALPESPLAQLSVIFLWAGPLFGALCLVEIAKLICPRLAEWQSACRENDQKLQVAVRVLALCLSGVQGYGVVSTLGSAGLLSDPQPAMMVVAMAGFVGTTAITIWIAEQLRMPQGDLGIWVLLLVHVMLTFANNATGYVYAIGRGALTVEACIVLAGFLAVAIGMIRSLYCELSSSTSKSIDMLVWPPILAQVTTGYLIRAVILVKPMETQADINRMRIWIIAAICALIPFFAYGYFRRRIGKGASPAEASERKAFCKVVVAQIVIVIGAAMIDSWSQAFLVVNPQILIAGIAMALVVLSTTASRRR